MKVNFRIKMFLITVIVFLLSFCNGYSVLANTTVKVLEQAKVRTKLVRLGEIAEIKGEDRQLVEKLKSIVLGKAPLPGEMKEISGHYIEARVRRNDIDFSELTLNLPKKIQVVSEGVEVSSQKIEEMVKNFILKKMPWDPKQVSIKVSDKKDIALTAGEITYEVVPRKGEDYLGATNLLLVFMVNGSVEKRLWVTTRIDVNKEVVLSNRPLRRHNIITREDIRLEKRNLAELPTDVITDPLEVIGKRTKRAIDPHIPIRFNYLEVPPLVRRGDLVIIVAETDALKITTQGIVTEDGCKGAMVRVINTGSRKEVYARVIDSRTVEVEF
jgi:flagella basal body P-ring formation protein FlgA